VVVHCVNSRWVNACEAEGARVSEEDEAFAVDVTEVPRGGHRRRKSMEPCALLNIGGNIVRGERSERKGSFSRTSMGRPSLGRSPVKALVFDSPAKALSFIKPSSAGLERSDSEKENSATPDGMDKDSSEPATPAYLAAPETLVQMTAPMSRVRKLEFKGVGGRGLGKGDKERRRLTSHWE
jgi:hypothetical protein